MTNSPEYFFTTKTLGVEWIRFLISFFQTGFTGLMGFFSPAASEMPSGRRPFYPDNPV
jgi:hypothetical protein